MLTACASGVISQDYALRQGKDEGIVIVGVWGLDPGRDNHVTAMDDVVFAAYDEEKQDLAGGLALGRVSFRHHRYSHTLTYHVLKFPAGTHVLRYYQRSAANMGVIHRSQIAYCDGTLEFEVTPGRSTYIGNVAIINGRYIPAGRDLAGAKAALEEYPNLGTKPIIEVTPQPAVFAPRDGFFAANERLCHG